MQVRRASTIDLAALTQLSADVQEQHRAALPQVYRAMTPDEVQTWLRRRLSDVDVVVLVAVEAEATLGFVVVRRDAGPASPFTHARVRAVVDSLGVAPSARRRGVGRALMAAAEERAREWSASSVVLDVMAFNQGADAFYRALGYGTASLRLMRRL